MLDAVIIGSGPAGLSAALCLKLHEKQFIWYGAHTLSDKVGRSEKIANYPGLGLLSGEELNAAFTRHMAEMNLTMEDKMVTSIMPMGDHYALLADNDMVETKTVLLATGVAPGKGFEGEANLVGRGVSYCATCDGFLYKGKTIAVYCGAPRFEHEVTYLAELAEKVYLAVGYAGCEINLPNVERIGAIRSVQGGLKLSGITLADGTELAVSGLFCLRNAVSPGTLVPGLAVEGAHIVVNRQQETNLPGCYAAGDCTGRPYQIAKAVGEGNVAAHALLEYLAAQEKKA